MAIPEAVTNMGPTPEALQLPELVSPLDVASPNPSPVVTIHPAANLESQGASGDVDTLPQVVRSDSQTGLMSKDSSTHACKIIDDVHEDAIYILQKIIVDQQLYNLFYDNGCKRFCSRHKAIRRLGKRATLLEPGPMTLGGVGGMRMETPHGRYGVRLPIRGGCEVLMSGMCLDTITETFPTYPLLGQVFEDIKAAYRATGGNVKDLPVLEPSVGGDTDLMIGIPYMKIFPEQVFKMDCGLTIYRSYFKNASGGYGVVGGSHQVFTDIENQHHLRTANFISSQLKIFTTGYQVNPDVRLLGYQSTYTDKFNHYIEDSAVTDAAHVDDSAMLQEYVDNHPSVAPKLTVYEDDVVESSDVDSVFTLNNDFVQCVNNDSVLSPDNDSVLSLDIDSVISVNKDAAVSGDNSPVPADCDAAVSVDNDSVMTPNNDTVPVDKDFVISVNVDSVLSLNNDAVPVAGDSVVSVKNQPVVSVSTALEKLVEGTIKQDANGGINSAHPNDSSAAQVDPLTVNTLQQLLNADMTHNAECSQDNVNTDTSDLTDDDVLAGFADYMTCTTCKIRRIPARDAISTQLLSR